MSSTPISHWIGEQSHAGIIIGGNIYGRGRYKNMISVPTSYIYDFIEITRINSEHCRSGLTPSNVVANNHNDGTDRGLCMEEKTKR